MIRFSNLKHMALSPAHVRYAEQQPETVTPDKANMRIGVAAHTMILSAGARIAVFEGKQRRGAAWEAFQLANADKLILNQTEYGKAQKIADAVKRCPQAQELLARAPHREQQLQWDLAGRACRGTPDAFGSDILIDVKTTKTAHPDRFAWEARRMGYHAQLDWYRQALSTHPDARPREVYIIAVENKAPYPVTCFKLSEELLAQGYIMWSAWFERYCVCQDSQHWPAYSEAIEPLDVAQEEDMGFDLPTEDVGETGEDDDE